VVRSVAYEGGGVHRIGVHAPPIAGDLKTGESVAVAGACLTVVESWGDVFYVQMMSESGRATRLDSIKPGDRVNLERALRLGDRFDGHMVLGHVDCAGRVSGITNEGNTRKFWITAPSNISWGIAPKGSITVEGVSLTVIDAPGKFDEDFSVGLIPTTLRETTLGDLAEGYLVNIEIDVLARYAARILNVETGEARSNESNLTWEKLQEYGW
jgi:riboflavin synthase